MIMGKFTAFCNRTFPLRQWEARARDQRRRPQIAPSVVMRVVTEMVCLGQKSLLAVDQFVRTVQARRWHGSHRAMVVSDTTLERSLRGWDLAGTRQALTEALGVLEGQGRLESALPSGRRMRVGLVDSSEFGGFHGCVFAISGALDVAVDIQMHGRGKELEASAEVLQRCGAEVGVEIVVGDALYLCAPHIQRCRQGLGAHALVKTRQQSLTIIQDAEGLFQMPPQPADGIQRAEGIDRRAATRWRIRAAAGFRWQQMPYEFKVARVEEHRLKPAPGRAADEVFWVVTTDTSLSGQDMRQLAHRRWGIENNVFKRLNALVGSKRVSTHNQHVKEAQLLIWLLGLVMFGLWVVLRAAGATARIGLAGAKLTWGMVARVLVGSLWTLGSAGV